MKNLQKYDCYEINDILETIRKDTTSETLVVLNANLFFLVNGAKGDKGIDKETEKLFTNDDAINNWLNGKITINDETSSRAIISYLVDNKIPAIGILDIKPQFETHFINALYSVGIDFSKTSPVQDNFYMSFSRMTPYPPAESIPISKLLFSDGLVHSGSDLLVSEKMLPQLLPGPTKISVTNDEIIAKFIKNTGLNYDNIMFFDCDYDIDTPSRDFSDKMYPDLDPAALLINREEFFQLMPENIGNDAILDEFIKSMDEASDYQDNSFGDL